MFPSLPNFKGIFHRSRRKHFTWSHIIQLEPHVSASEDKWLPGAARPRPSHWGDSRPCLLSSCLYFYLKTSLLSILILLVAALGGHSLSICWALEMGIVKWSACYLTWPQRVCCGTFHSMVMLRECLSKWQDECFNLGTSTRGSEPEMSEPPVVACTIESVCNFSREKIPSFH